MSSRLKSLINELYHPTPTNGRQVFACSRVEAEKLPRLPTVAVISVTAPERPLAAVDGFEFLLRLQFEDVDFLNRNISLRAKQKLPRAFTAEQAALIHAYVEGLPASINTIVVHCEGGYSRSAAVAIGLHRLYGYRVELDRLEQANPSVVTVLTRQNGPLFGSDR